jgi:hypothetical protein
MQSLPGQLVEALPGQLITSLPDSVVEFPPNRLTQALPGQVVQSLSGQLVRPLPGQIVSTKHGSSPVVSAKAPKLDKLTPTTIGATAELSSRSGTAFRSVVTGEQPRRLASVQIPK